MQINHGFNGKPKLPKYLKDGKTFVLTIDKTRLGKKKCLSNEFLLPKYKRKFKMPDYIDKSKIKCLRLLKFYGKIKLEIIYETDEIKNDLNMNSYIGIDLGVSNICAITINDHNFSWIIKGGKIKSINQFYNKKLAEMKSQLEICNSKKTSKRVEKLTYKRNNKIDYYFHCISKKIISICLENKIGNITIGHNKNWKQKCNMRKDNAQNFVCIPFNKLISMIQYKGLEQGISVNVVEEAYTSKCDHLANEEMKHHESYLGKRATRGIFRSSIGRLLNADINGAIGMIRKKNGFTDAQIMSLRDRGDVISPEVLDV